MKRLSVILFASFYLVLSAGVHVHIDKCCDSIHAMMLVSPDECCDTKTDTEEKTCCDSKGCGDHKGCDKDELHLQFSEEFLYQLKIQKEVFVLSIHPPSLLRISTPSQDPLLEGSQIEPPDPPGAVYELHSSFLFYG